MGAAAASAAINFSYEYGESGNLIAGGYVGLLSVLSMTMFHEFLSQFEDAIEEETAGLRGRRKNPKFGLRWITWPTNTLRAAVAWLNHPPAPGTPATVAEAVAHLERVQERKREARRRRRLDRVADRSAAGGSGGSGDSRSSQAPVVRVDAAVTEPVTQSRPTPRRVIRASEGRRTSSPVAEVRVPLTEQTLLEWANTWVRVCADTELWAGPWTDDDRARELYGRGARQLRRLRQAVLSGALRRQADELGVALPAGFVDQPESLPPGVGDDAHA